MSGQPGAVTCEDSASVAANKRDALENERRVRLQPVGGPDLRTLEHGLLTGRCFQGECLVAKSDSGRLKRPVAADLDGVAGLGLLDGVLERGVALLGPVPLRQDDERL